MGGVKVIQGFGSRLKTVKAQLGMRKFADVGIAAYIQTPSRNTASPSLSSVIVEPTPHVHSRVSYVTYFVHLRGL